MVKYTDENILQHLRSSNEGIKNQALKQLYAQHFPIIANFISKNNGSEEEAADIFQDAIVAFYEKVRLDELVMNCSIRTYIYSICKHLWLNRLRAKKREVSIDDEIKSIAIPPESLSIIANEERTEMIMKIMNKLNPDCVKVLTHYYFERLKMKEIAIRMGFANEQVAKNKKSGCMKNLKKLVSQFPDFENMLR